MVKLFLSTAVSKIRHEFSVFIVLCQVAEASLLFSSDFFISILPGCSCCKEDGEPSDESRSGNLQNSRQTRATDKAALATFDPQQTAYSLVPLVRHTSPSSTGQGE